ncbi:MAG TPA: cob(I)yrinic acid a,c-diamide adenosyltransferase [Dehalococcoidia bacterium]|nr:cob(I)yrinic acid a,c-diamide adenosyltransferase [Dehalococcoidia bacterium]
MTDEEPAPRKGALLYTGKGDAGETGLLGGERVPKWDVQPQAYGAIDEASSAIGLARALASSEETKEALVAAQRALYRIMAELATSPEVELDADMRISEADVRQLEAQTDAFGARVSLGREFVLPGETTAGAALDLARTTVRRAEREAARLAHERGIGGAAVLAYVNRLSSLLFVLERFEDQLQGREARPARIAGQPKRTARNRTK